MELPRRRNTRKKFFINALRLQQAFMHYSLVGAARYIVVYYFLSGAGVKRSVSCVVYFVVFDYWGNTEMYWSKTRE